MTLFENYITLQDELLKKRTAKSITEEEEDKFSDELEYIWWELTDEEQNSIRLKSKNRFKNKVLKK